MPAKVLNRALTWLNQKAPLELTTRRIVIERKASLRHRSLAIHRADAAGQLASGHSTSRCSRVASCSSSIRLPSAEPPYSQSASRSYIDGSCESAPAAKRPTKNLSF